MTTINLQQEQQREQLVNGAGKLSTSLIFFLVISATFLLAWGGLVFGTLFLEKRNTSIKAQIVSANVSLNEKNLVDEIFDLQTRLGLIKGNLAIKPDLGATLDKVAKVVIPGIAFSTYMAKDKQLLITMHGSNFDLISRQIFSFKQADFSAGVDLLNLARDQKGVGCQIAIRLK